VSGANGSGGRLARTFTRRAAAKEKVLVAYLCVGDPTVDESIAIARAALDGGADVLELGVPFSDPTADGPVIARASQRAIRAGGGLDATLRAARELRRTTDAPLVVFGYFNPLFVRGEERVVDEAADAGVDALLVVDLPLDEGTRLRARARERGVAIVPLLAPTSSSERVDAVRDLAAEGNAGFVYYVSLTGVTGADQAPLVEASAVAGRLRQRVGIPTVIGFGIDGPEKARTAAEHVDGVVVGTALVRRVETGSSAEARCASVRDLIASLRSGLGSP